MEGSKRRVAVGSRTVSGVAVNRAGRLATGAAAAVRAVVVMRFLPTIYEPGPVGGGVVAVAVAAGVAGSNEESGELVGVDADGLGAGPVLGGRPPVGGWWRWLSLAKIGGISLAQGVLPLWGDS
jgi:hypothetical protein